MPNYINVVHLLQDSIVNENITLQPVSVTENAETPVTNSEKDPTPGNDVTNNRGRKRKRNIGAQNTCQMKRNRGMSYSNRRGKGRQVDAVKPGPDCKCKFHCFDRISQHDREKIFDEFWKLGNFNLQNSYLFGCLKQETTKRKTKKTNSPSKRCYSFQYYVGTTDGVKVRVCKMAFLSVHGLQNHRGRVENIAASLKKGCVTPPSDKRGKHQNHPKKYNDEVIEGVRLFINQLPTYESHYSRKKSPEKKFMTMDYTIELCFNKYKEECLNESRPHVSSDKFRRIFTEEFNISFKNPKCDTCHECDSINIALQGAKNKNDLIALKELTQKKELHQRRAQAGQDAIKFATENGRAVGTYVITFDLQQALPTPKLSTGPTFYKKKILSYNLSVHCCSENQGYFYFWDESIAGRGADEIASCLLKHFQLHNISGSTLIAISDNCTGQNKNWTIVAAWLRLLAKGTFKKIVHIFPQVGHTMLPSDRDFGIVETYVRRHCQFVYSPSEWKNILETCQKKKPFIVHAMTREDFVKVSQMRDAFCQKSGSHGFGIRNAVRLKFSSEDPSVMLASECYNGDLQPISLRKKGRPSNFLGSFRGPLSTKYDGPRPIEASKLADVMSCMRWIPEVHHEYYKTLNSE